MTPPSSADVQPSPEGEVPAAAPFGLYIHFPFCRSRCHYCAFYFVVGRAWLREPYLSALLVEIRAMAADPRYAGRGVDSIYLGGGTPSLLEPEELDRLLEAIHEEFPVPPGAEVSLEANPDGLTLAKARGFREAGCNRITLGWQSLERGNLRALTRTHSPDDNRRALEDVRAAGFGNVGVDLIFGLPGQGTGDWRRELDEVASLSPDHVSAYELTMEEGTRFFDRNRRGRLELPSEEARARMFEETEDVLSSAGIHRYEISNFARPGLECRHNLCGWRSGDLLGVGASAASHVANARWTNVADLDEYIRRVEGGDEPALPAEILDEEIWAAEDLYLGLRTSQGIDARTRLERVPEKERGRLQSVLDRARERGLLEETEERIRLTRRGLLFADSVFEELLVR